MRSHWETIKAVALEAGHKPLTIRKWKERGRVPYRVRRDLEERARRKRRAIPYEAFDSAAS